MRSDRPKFAMAFALLLVFPAALPAGTFPVADLLAFQDLTVDLTYAYINAGVSDPSSILTYAGSFDATAGTGTFGGTYLGDPISGTLTETVSGDPQYNATTTTDSKNNKNITMTAQFTQIDDTNQYMVNARLGSNIVTGTMTMTMDNDFNTIYTGVFVSNTANGPVKYPVTFIYNDFTLDVTSIVGNPPNPYVDSGTVDNLEGIMSGLNITVSTVPEPSAAILAGVGSVIGLALAAFRKRKGPQRPPARPGTVWLSAYPRPPLQLPDPPAALASEF
jgi:hypothetical protein